LTYHRARRGTLSQDAFFASEASCTFAGMIPLRSRRGFAFTVDSTLSVHVNSFALSGLFYGTSPHPPPSPKQHSHGRTPHLERSRSYNRFERNMSRSSLLSCLTNTSRDHDTSVVFKRFCCPFQEVPGTVSDVSSIQTSDISLMSRSLHPITITETEQPVS
jgi:hypothetical protein